jgi:hypothetical protein
MVKTSMRTRTSVQQALRDVDGDRDPRLVVDHEVERDQSPTLEDQQVAGRVGLDCLDPAEVLSVGSSDAGSDQFVNPQLPRAFERGRFKRQSADGLGVVTIVDSDEADKVATLVRSGRLDGQRTTGGAQLRAGLQPAGVAPEIHVDLAP